MLALERFVTRVSAHVPAQHGLTGKRPRANVALERLFSSVRVHVLTQIGLRPEPLSGAYFTLVASLKGVLEGVSC